MARNATSLSTRLKKLEAALAKTRSIPCGTTLSFEPMTSLLGISRPVLRDWCNEIPDLEDTGCVERGGNGMEWKFEPRSTVMALIRHFETIRDAAAAKARAMKDIAGGPALEAVPDDFDIRETREMVRLSLEVQDARERQGELVNARQVATALREMFAAMQSAGLQAVQKMDQLGQWPPEIRSSVEDEIQSLMLTQERAARTCLGKLNGGTA